MNIKYSHIANTSNTKPEWLLRGYTGHEHLPEFNLINMNGRMYDPLIARMLSPDNYVQSASSTQAYNRYSYAYNNPLKYTDPSGDFIFTLGTLIAAPFTGGASLAFLPAAIGADLGMWSGGSMANGTMNPFKWDYSSGKTWGYMAGGALAGAASGYIGGAVATSGMPFANTTAIIAGSTANSILTAGYTNFQTDVSVSFGAASYNFAKNEWGYLGKTGNSTFENIGYGLGALANVQDAFAGIEGGIAYVKSRKELFGHSWVEGDGINISVGPAEDSKLYLTDGKFNDLKWESQYLFKTVKGRNFKPAYKPEETFSTTLNNISVNRLQKMTNFLNKGLSLNGRFALHYGVWNGCVNQTSRALFMSGVLNVNAFLPITSPVLLNAELVLRNYGMMFSYYMTTYK